MEQMFKINKDMNPFLSFKGTIIALLLYFSINLLFIIVDVVIQSNFWILVIKDIMAPTAIGIIWELIINKLTILYRFKGALVLFLFGAGCCEIWLAARGPFRFDVVAIPVTCIEIVVGLRFCNNWLTASCSMWLIYAFTLFRSSYQYFNEGNDQITLGQIFPFLCLMVCAYMTAFIFYSSEYLERLSFFFSYNHKMEKKQWKEILHNLPDGILITHHNSLLYSNPSALQIFNLDSSENSLLIKSSLHKKILEEGDSITPSTTGKSLGDIILSHPLNSSLYSSPKPFIRLEESGDLQTMDTVGYLECRFLPMTYQNKECLVTVIKDQTTYKELQEEKIAKSHQRRLFFTITHEFRSPLNAIIVLTNYIVQNGGMTPELANNIKIIKNNGNLLLNLVNDLLDLSQLESNELTIVDTLFKIDEVIHDVIELFNFQAQKKNIELEAIFKNGVPQTIMADMNRFRQVLINLISNALKFTKKGSIIVTVSYEIISSIIKVKVKDTGIGIKEEEKGRLFQMFGKIMSSLKMNLQGVGLGLSICKQLCEKMGGSIYCHSKYGSGTCFTFTIKDKNLQASSPFIGSFASIIGGQNVSSTLPVNYSFSEKQLPPHKIPVFHKKSVTKGLFEEEKKTSILHLRNSTKISFKKLASYEKINDDFETATCQCPHILLVDDNSYNLFTLQILLKSVGKEADQANSGKEAVRMLVRSNYRVCCRPYDLILMDFSMPEMNGIETTAVIRQKIENGDIKDCIIVGLTGHESPLIHEDAQKAGMNEILLKPINKDMLEELALRYVKDDIEDLNSDSKMRIKNSE